MILGKSVRIDRNAGPYERSRRLVFKDYMDIKRIDKIKWWIQTIGSSRIPQPLCPIHDLRLNPIRPYNMSIDEATSLRCEDCSNLCYIPRSWGKRKTVCFR